MDDDSDILSNFELLSSFSNSKEIDNYTIYDGITNNFEELGKSIGDTDIGQVRYFNAGGSTPIQMWEILGFSDSDAGVPDSPRYWNNIIPETTKMSDRSGVSTITDSEGNESLEIIEEDPQTWIGTNEYGNTYYYPVLPRLNKFGKFDEDLGLQGGNTPFGTDGRNWNEDDIYAYITNSDIEDDYLLIDIESKEIERNIFNDRSGNDIVGMGISDYKVRFDTETVKPVKNKFISRINLGKTKDGAF